MALTGDEDCSHQAQSRQLSQHIRHGQLHVLSYATKAGTNPTLSTYVCEVRRVINGNYFFSFDLLIDIF